MLEANQLNLTTIAMVSHLLTPGNKDGVLARIRGRSQREVKAIVAEHDPRPAIPRDRMELIVVQAPVRPCGEPLLASPVVAAPAASPEQSDPSRSRAEGGESPRAVNPANPMEAITETYTKISFAAGGAFMAKFRKIQSLAWHRLPANPSVEKVLELAMDGFLEREDPNTRRERREKRQEPAARGAESREKRSEQPPRYIAAAVRDEVYSRDEGRCAFVGSNGRRCGSTQAVQMDHIVPVARGGRGTPDNLRLLCAYHNRLEAERLMGTVPMAHARERNRQLPLRQ